MDIENNNTDIGKPTSFQNIFRIILGAFLLLAGTGHLTWSRIEFTAQVPAWVPASADRVVILSGLVEIFMGACLLFLSRQRITVGWIVALFFVLVFPGNIAQYINKIDAFGLNSDASRALRLVFQPVLVIWALWSTGAWRSWRSRRP